MSVLVLGPLFMFIAFFVVNCSATRAPSVRTVGPPARLGGYRRGSRQGFYKPNPIHGLPKSILQFSCYCVAGA